MSRPTIRTVRRAARVTVRAAAVTTAILVSIQCGNLSAYAADGDGIAGYPSAQQVLQSNQVRDTVSRFLVSAVQANPGSPSAAADGGAVGAPGNTPAAVAAPPRFDLKDPVPMFELSPDFVTGKAQATPQTALRLTYLASRVTASDGHQAAVLLAPQGNPATAQGDGQHNVGAEGWQLAGIRDGDTELGLAERGTPQARTFTEPQIHAWYRLTADGAVEPLNEEATTSLGGQRSMPLAAYQKLVATRYADKLPGSEYDRKGLAGGFAGLTDGQADNQADNQADGQADYQASDRAAQVAAGTGERAAEHAWQPVAVTGAAALAAVGAAALYTRRRRTSTTR
ncbi:hypothetical protein F7Q99_02295 [Streptomyces kaniharaensis]|uniref:Uncharacterized protein n=1 Tax=Streptomyces kaniharaensis TaxID=212423 RepID=A0A6N7KK64_9ACTN|nr:hypothetical protein [Streptomyces kaniharaensis]MQS11145.1 hypothetical protein [Streptomyces kaniharaensis]